MSSKEVNVKRVVVQVDNVPYPIAIGAEIKRMLAQRFGWLYISEVKDESMLIAQWREGDSGKPEPLMEQPLPNVPRSVVKDLAEALGHFVSTIETVREYVERNEKAPCHIGLTTVYGCSRCSKNIHALRTLQVARAHGLLE